MALYIVAVGTRLPPHLRSAGGRHHGAHDSPGHMRVSQILCSLLVSGMLTLMTCLVLHR